MISFKHRDDDGSTQQKLQKGKVRAIHYKECQKMVQIVKLPDEFKDTKWEVQFNELFGNYQKTIPKTTACTLGHNNVDTCQGDSGGPLVTKTKKVKNQRKSRMLSGFQEIFRYSA